MTIEFGCPSCGKRLEVPASLAGRTGRCKKCGGPFTIPRPDDSQSLAEDAEEDAYADLPGRAVEATPDAPMSRGRGRKASGAGRPGRGLAEGSGFAIGLGVAGCLAVVVGLVLADRLVLTLKEDGMRFLGRPRGVWMTIGTIMLLGAGAKGAAHLLRLGHRGGTKGRETVGTERIAGGVVLALGLLVVGARYMAGPSGLFAASAGGDNDPELQSFEHRKRVNDQINKLQSDDATERIAGAEALTAIRSGPADLRQQVAMSLHSRFNTAAGPERAAIIRALGYWGDGEDAKMAEHNRNDPDPEIARAASEAFDRLKGRK